VIVQKYQNSGRQILERDKRGRRICKRRSEGSSGVTRGKMQKRKEGATLEGENIHS